MADEDEVKTGEEHRRQEIDEIGRAVKAVRNARGWSLRRLAGDAGVSASLVSAIETGKIVPTVGSLFAISDALGEPAQRFFPARRQLSGVGNDEQEGVPVATEPAITPGSGPILNASTSLVPEPAPALKADPSPTTTAAAAAAHDLLPKGGAATRRPTRRVRRRQLQLSRPRVAAPARQAAALDGPRAETAVTGIGQVAGDRVSPTVDRREAVAAGQPAPIDPPGVKIIRAADRQTINLENGERWTIPFDSSGTIGQVIELEIPPGMSPPTHHRVQHSPVTVLVIRGQLVVEVTFSRVVLDPGDSATIGQGVPYRLWNNEATVSRSFVVFWGSWDGRL